MDISMDDIEINLQADPEDQFDEEMEAAYEATNDSIIQTLNSQTALFKFKNNRLPKGAEELVEASFLQNVPEPPKPGKYVMDENGQWSFEPANDQPAEKAPATQPATQPAEDISDAQAEKTAESLGKIVKLFKTQKGRLPESLHELVEQDYIKAIPQAPEGKAYKLDPKLGLVDVVDAEDATPARKKLKPLSRSERDAARSDLQTLKAMMVLFKFKEQRWPKNLQELVETGLMQEIPEAPGNREWIYDAETGEISLEGEDL
jgi:competence protein ComGC